MYVLYQFTMHHWFCSEFVIESFLGLFLFSGFVAFDLFSLCLGCKILSKDCSYHQNWVNPQLFLPLKILFVRIRFPGQKPLKLFRQHIKFFLFLLIINLNLICINMNNNFIILRNKRKILLINPDNKGHKRFLRCF